MIAFDNLKNLDGKRVTIFDDANDIYVGKMSNIRASSNQQLEMGVMAIVDFDYMAFLGKVIAPAVENSCLFINVLEDYVLSKKSENFPLRLEHCLCDYEELIKKCV